MEEAGLKAQAAVNKAKDDYNNSVKKLSEEVVQLEMVKSFNHMVIINITYILYKINFDYKFDFNFI